MGGPYGNGWSVKREKPTRYNNQMFIINVCLNMFRASLCPSSGVERPCYCIWCIALVLLDVVGSGCGALRCRMWALLASHFVWLWEQTAINSLYSINSLVCITEKECVYCAVRTGYLNVIWVICFTWIWEQTAIISLYNINWLVFITATECVYCAVRPVFVNVFQFSFERFH